MTGERKRGSALRPLTFFAFDATLGIYMRQTIIAVVMILLSALLTGAILLQQRGSGLGAAFGGDSNVFRTKRGLEKGLFYATIALSFLFFGTAILNLLAA